MITTTVRIAGQVFVLNPSQDVALLKTHILAASRHGSDFVDIDAVGHDTVSVLITPTESVSVETLEHSDDEPSGSPTSRPAFDVAARDYFD